MKSKLLVFVSVGLLLLGSSIGCSSQNGEKPKNPNPKASKVVSKAPKVASSVNYGCFKKIKIGEKIEKVLEILKDKPTRINGEGDKKEYIWESKRVVNINKKGVKCTSAIILQVEKGVVVSKRQRNLGSFGKVVPDKEKLKKLKASLAEHKLTYQEACKIMGGSGLLFKQSRYGKRKRQEYIWQGTPLKGRTVKSGEKILSVSVSGNKVRGIYVSKDLEDGSQAKKAADQQNKATDKQNKATDKQNKVDGKNNKVTDKQNKAADKPNKVDGKNNKVTDKQNKVDDKQNKAAAKQNETANKEQKNASESSGKAK